ERVKNKKIVTFAILAYEKPIKYKNALKAENKNIIGKLAKPPVEGESQKVKRKSLKFCTGLTN
ncbi:unnamed protein product, partial [marine sediment metagenome]